MKKFLPYCLAIMLGLPAAGNSYAQNVDTPLDDAGVQVADSLDVNPAAVFEAMPQPEVNDQIVNLSFTPRVFAGYRKIHGIPEYSKRDFYTGLGTFQPINGDEIADINEEIYGDTVPRLDVDPNLIDVVNSQPIPDISGETPSSSAPNLLTYERPEWFQNALTSRMTQEDLQYAYMIDNPTNIEYAYWDLPTPPVLLEEDRSFLAFINKQEIPEIDHEDALIPGVELKKINWLHKVGTQLQFSQAYVSPNWYQGGNNYLSMLFNFNWNVQLNQVYHPNLLFQSDLTYKVAFSSNPKGYRHKYTIAEDNFQYNLNTGVKAAKNWYYSFNLQFKTQLFNNFEEDSDQRTAAFLSPADLNMGLGMSYNHANDLKTFQITVTISPLSYNLKTCLKPNDIIDHATYGIAADKHTKSEIGSNVDISMDWKITSNISYKTRLFMFTDYKYFLGDWQNTINFDINKFLSTQIFVNLRYDGSTENYGKWKKFMMREILSFGLSYTFSTKP